jgi:hypothetical protein
MVVDGSKRGASRLPVYEVDLWGTYPNTENYPPLRRGGSCWGGRGLAGDCHR